MKIAAVVQVASASGTDRPRIVYPPTEVSEFDVRIFNLGLPEREVAPGVSVIYRAARSVVDVMRMRRRVGDPVALRARRLLRATGPPGSAPRQLSGGSRLRRVQGAAAQSGCLRRAGATPPAAVQVRIWGLPVSR